MFKNIANKIAENRKNTLKIELNKIDSQIEDKTNQKNILDKEGIYHDDFLYIRQEEMKKLLQFNEVKQYANLLYVKLKNELAHLEESVVDTAGYAITGAPVYKTRGSKEDIAYATILADKIENQLGLDLTVVENKSINEKMEALKANKNVASYTAEFEKFQESLKDCFEEEKQIKGLEKEIINLQKARAKIETKYNKINTKVNNLEI